MKSLSKKYPCQICGATDDDQLKAALVNVGHLQQMLETTEHHFQKAETTIAEQAKVIAELRADRDEILRKYRVRATIIEQLWAVVKAADAMRELIPVGNCANVPVNLLEPRSLIVRDYDAARTTCTPGGDK